MNDTENKTAEVYRKMLLGILPQQRLQLAAEMFSAARKIVLSSLQIQKLNEKQVRLQLFQRFYGADFPGEEKKKILDYLGSH
jgi:hypothetical protein